MPYNVDKNIFNRTSRPAPAGREPVQPPRIEAFERQPSGIQNPGIMALAILDELNAA